MNSNVSEGLGCFLILAGLALLLIVIFTFSCEAYIKETAVAACRDHIHNDAQALTDCIKAARN